MKRYMIHSFLLIVSVVVFAACGTDNKENSPDADGPYSFFDATTPLKITAPSIDENGTVTGDDYNISVTLLEFNLVKSDEVITMKPFASAYGFLTETSVNTDTNGRATFIYTAPTGSEYTAIKGQNITIQAVYVDSGDGASTTTSSEISAPDVLITQDFVLQFR